MDKILIKYDNLEEVATHDPSCATIQVIWSFHHSCSANASLPGWILRHNDSGKLACANSLHFVEYMGPPFAFDAFPSCKVNWLTRAVQKEFWLNEYARESQDKLFTRDLWKQEHGLLQAAKMSTSRDTKHQKLFTTFEARTHTKLKEKTGKGYWESRN